MTTTPFLPSDHLKTPEDVAEYIQHALTDPFDAALVAAVLGDVAKSEGMTAVADRTGLTREGLYRSLSGDRDPRLSTVLKVLAAFGLKLSVVPIQDASPATEASTVTSLAN